MTVHLSESYDEVQAVMRTRGREADPVPLR